MKTEQRQLPHPVLPGRFSGSVKVERYTPAPGTPKTCPSCHEQKAIEEFGTRAASVDGRDYYCRACRAARGRAIYHARKALVAERRWKRIKGDTLLAFVGELLGASEMACTYGMWRGRSAIRAYKRLRDALELFQRDGEYDPSVMDRLAKDCTCPDYPCPRHAPETQEE